ncbi:hypothetical protein BJY52DRAFT_1329163 [Lactarius psammicola]|nr:hypothetical protein BJY52DRAFT_1329163 [Lactarius psammicola]
MRLTCTRVLVLVFETAFGSRAANHMFLFGLLFRVRVRVFLYVRPAYCIKLDAFGYCSYSQNDARNASSSVLRYIIY